MENKIIFHYPFSVFYFFSFKLKLCEIWFYLSCIIKNLVRIGMNLNSFDEFPVSAKLQTNENNFSRSQSGRAAATRTDV